MKEKNIFPAGYELLSEREKTYFKLMNSKSGVLYISAPPGYAKSAIMRAIANKLDAQYFDIRLSMVDETDVGLFPSVDIVKTSEGDKKMLCHVAPEWAYKSNERLTIIHFEELNRANLAVRNAALQILLEREIGTFFKFNDNVLMVASGNLGEEDGTDVEEFDQALNNRLLHFEHDLPITEWIENYANENVSPTIVNFLKVYPQYYWKKPEDDQKSKAYPTPRSWTFLSDYIWTNFGEQKYVEKTENGKTVLDKNGNPKKVKQFPQIEEWVNDVRFIIHSFVGPTGLHFIRYCEDTLKISLDDILNNFEKHKLDVENFNRDKKSELLVTMKERKVSNLKPKQMNNLINFLKTISKDECISYVLHVLDTEYDIDDESDDNKIGEDFLADERFDPYRATIMGHVNDDTLP